jgi:hypothetical protein
MAKPPNQMLRYLCYAIASLAPLWSANAAQVLHLEGRAFLQDSRASIPLARGSKLPRNAHLVVDGHLQIEISANTFLEIRGPARASLKQGLFWSFESGRFLIFTRGLSPHRFRILNEILRPDEAALEVEIPFTRNYAQILSLWGSSRIRGESLESSKIYVLDAQRLQSGEIDKTAALRRRDSYTFSEVLFRQIDEKAAISSLRNQFLFSQLSHLNRMRPDDPALSTTSSIGLGVRTEWIHKRYFQLPRKPTRIHYLRAPAIRFGGGVSYASTGLASLNAQQGRQHFGAHGVLGVSWLGLSLDGLVSPIAPIRFGVRALYEWDLKDFTANDMMFGLGYSYSVSKVGGEQPLTWAIHALNASLIFNF